MSSFLVIYFCVILSQVTCASKNFQNYAMYEVTAFNSRERALLYNLCVRNDMVVFINGVTNEAAVPMDVMVDGGYTEFFEEKLNENDIEYIKIRKAKLVRNKDDIIVRLMPHSYQHLPNITTEFHTWETLMLWVELKLKKFPGLKKIRIGKSFEKREIFALKISSGKKNSAVFLLGGEDGKDWMSPALLLNFVDFILEHKFNVDLLTRHYDFYILPMLNPDGYDYSVMKERFWSKNRKVYFPKKMCPNNSSAIGINIDRNWYFNKNIIRDEECYPVYSGSKSISEEETESLAKFLDNIAMQMLAFINVRGFETLVTVPYAHNSEYCNNYPVLMDILSSVYDRVKADHGKTFYYGATAAYYYNFTGNVADWVKKKLNTPIVYTFYMKVEEFIFPSPTDIQPLTEEFATMMKEILLLASSIYSPLFNNQTRNLIQSIFIIINVICAFAI